MKAYFYAAYGHSWLRAAALMAPLLLFLTLTFVVSLSDMLYRSVDNRFIPHTLSHTMSALRQWDGAGIPQEPTFVALYADLQAAHKQRTSGKLANRLNYSYSGARSVIVQTVRRLNTIDSPTAAAFGAINADWLDPALWRVIANHAPTLTIKHYLDALDLTTTKEGTITSKGPDQVANRGLLLRTLAYSAAIACIALVLGYPVAYLMARVAPQRAKWIMLLVLLPFWTSLLARLGAWVVLLQTNGLLNDLLVSLGVVNDGQRLALIYNATGTMIAMVHIMLPFVVLPLYAVMRGIGPEYMRAAYALGASPRYAFWRVYFPLSLPGVGAGTMLAFILSVGYYITPALIGGQSGRFITNTIAYHMNTSLNWGLAAALSVLILGIVLTVVWCSHRFIGLHKIHIS